MTEEKKQLYIFIDSNIFLNFYDFHHEDLESLAQLVDLVESGEVKLFITKQVEEEIDRHRETRLAEAYERFKESKVSVGMPVICQAYGEYEAIRKAQKDLAKIKSELSKKLWSDIVSHSLEADKIIQNILGVSEKINSDEVLEDAKTRYLLGNPPGKKDGSHGDEINWEALLRFMPTDNHFIFVSDDKDFKSPLNENELRDYLLREWESKKGSKILFYRSLTSFFKEHKINIELRWEEEKDRLVRELQESPNFSTTHGIIRMLSKFISFSEAQVKNMGKAVITNSQIAWIAQDADVKQFYEKYVLSQPRVFTEGEWLELQRVFEISNEDDEIRIEDIPF